MRLARLAPSMRSEALGLALSSTITTYMGTPISLAFVSAAASSAWASAVVIVARVSWVVAAPAVPGTSAIAPAAAAAVPKPSAWRRVRPCSSIVSSPCPSSEAPSLCCVSKKISSDRCGGLQ